MWMKALAALGLASLSSMAMAIDCEALSNKAMKKGTPITGASADYLSTGKGDIAFYSGPDKRCLRRDHVLKPGIDVLAYFHYGKYTWVWYMIPEEQDEVTAWVLTSRVKPTGTGVSPVIEPDK